MAYGLKACSCHPLKDHPWHIVSIFCIYIYYIHLIFLRCVLLLYYCNMLNKSNQIKNLIASQFQAPIESNVNQWKEEFQVCYC